MKFCPQCGDALEGARKFCPECGADLLRPPAGPSAGVQSRSSAGYRRPAIIAVALVAALALGAVGYIALSNGALPRFGQDVVRGAGAGVDEGSATADEPGQAETASEEGRAYYVVCASGSRSGVESRLQDLARAMSLDPGEAAEMFFIAEASRYGIADDGPWLVMSGPWMNRASALESLESIRPYAGQGKCYLHGVDDDGSAFVPATDLPSIRDSALAIARDLGGVSQTGRELYFVVVATERSQTVAMEKRDAAAAAYGEQMYFIVEHSEHLDGFAPGYWLVGEAYSREPDANDLAWLSRVAEDAYWRKVIVRCDDPIPVVNELVE